MADEVIPASSIMIVLTVILLPILLFMTVRICRMVWKTEKAMPMMLITLMITLASLIGYFSFLIESVRYPKWCCSKASNCTCIQSVLADMPAFCLANAVILNLNVWIYFNLRIKAFINVGFGVKDGAVHRKSSVNSHNTNSMNSDEL